MIHSILMQTTLFASLIALPMSQAVAQDTTSDEAPATEAPSTTTEETATEQPSTDETHSGLRPGRSPRKRQLLEKWPNRMKHLPPRHLRSGGGTRRRKGSGPNRHVIRESGRDRQDGQRRGAPLRVELRHIHPDSATTWASSSGTGNHLLERRSSRLGDLGICHGMGKHFDSHRIGMGFAFVAEGPIQFLFRIFEPSARWDAVLGWLQIGASVGPGVSFHHAQRTVVHESKWDVGPVEVYASAGPSPILTRPKASRRAPNRRCDS